MTTINVVDGDIIRIAVAADLEVVIHRVPRMWDRDIRSELVINPHPTNPTVWWMRTLDNINAVTFHHTLSDSPHVTFRNYIRAKKRPTGPYSIWITQTGEALLCVGFELAVWHDHTGFYVTQSGKRLWGNSHLSVGLAGRLHEYMPAEVQLKRAAQLAADLIKDAAFPAIRGTSDICGHMDFIGTQCPGWRVVRHGKQREDRWKIKLFDLIAEELRHP